MADDARRLIAERLAAGTLPRCRAQRVFGGRGEGAPCGCCGELIAPAQIQYDVDDAEQIIPMHLQCYRLWVEESARRP